MEKLIQNFSKQVVDRFESIIEDSLRITAMPPIKGEITRGKIKWRGIRIVERMNDDMGIDKWVEQRGVRISKILSIKPHKIKI